MTITRLLPSSLPDPQIERIVADEPEAAGEDRETSRDINDHWIGNAMVTDRPTNSLRFVIPLVVHVPSHPPSNAVILGVLNSPACVRLHFSMTRFGDLARSTQDENEDEETNSLYESIGSKLLEWCDTRPNEVPSIDHLYHTNAIQRLNDIMACPIACLPPGWRDEISEITESLCPAELAIHGRRICRFLLKVTNVNPFGRAHFNPSISTRGLHPRIPAHSRHTSQLKFGEEQSVRPFPNWLPTFDNSESV
jgi:hypothetical protein